MKVTKKNFPYKSYTFFISSRKTNWLKKWSLWKRQTTQNDTFCFKLSFNKLTLRRFARLVFIKQIKILQIQLPTLVHITIHYLYSINSRYIMYFNIDCFCEYREEYLYVEWYFIAREIVMMSFVGFSVKLHIL